MEKWKRDFEWLRIRHKVKELVGKEDLPDLNAILFLIGMQELGYVKESFSKEEKQDLMHIAVCSLLSQHGYYELVGQDVDGWPHYEQSAAVAAKGEEAQEELLIESIISYFDSEEE